jgi:hypothetical protein
VHDVLRRLIDKVNGPNYLRGRGADALLQQHSSESGLVLSFRYPPRATFGDISPTAEWNLISVHVDGQEVCEAGLFLPEPIWVPMPAGSYQVTVRAPLYRRDLATAKVEVCEARPVVVNIFPGTLYEPKSGRVECAPDPVSE